MKISSRLIVFVSCILIAATTALRADVVETKNGSHITGKIVRIDPGVVVVSTDFAGEIQIKQSEVLSLSTDAPINIHMGGKEALQGTLCVAPLGAPPGSVGVTQTKTGNVVYEKLADISRIWELKSKDPEVAKLERHWSIEASVDVNGKTGTTEQIGTTYAINAKLASSKDTLKLYTFYNRQKSNHSLSADQLAVGVDYENNFHGRTSWYARDVAGYDHIKGIDASNTAASGVGYDLVVQKNGKLTVRGGLSYRYEDYGNTGTPTLRDMGLDFGLINQWTFKSWAIFTDITYTPSLENFEIYQIKHDSWVDLPMSNRHWSVHVGMINDYTSRPVPGTERLDTTYYAKLVLKLK